jgi:predicted dehydrogenase
LIEMPLCIEPSELAEITATLDSLPKSPRIMVGHNRRYSPHTERLRLWLSSRRSPLVMTIRVNAGFVPKDHWVHSENQGRSRIVGEMTHFLDLIIALAGSRITRIEAVRIAGDDRTTINNDNVGVLAALADGSIATLAYSAQGARGAPRDDRDYVRGRHADMH